MALAVAARHIPVGSAAPRLAPPLPAKSKIDEYRATAQAIGITLMNWQILAATYMTAIGLDGWLYREDANIVARRNGKTELLVPRIVMDLRAGKSIIHTAQNRILPRRVFFRVWRALDEDEVVVFRQANGQELLVHKSGGEYMIIAPKRGARGLGADTLIFDELREFEDFEIVGAAIPTLQSSPDPQTIYLSNAGYDASIVLNDLKHRAELGKNAELAYLEWSAAPERETGDRDGWAEANPAIGFLPRFAENLEHAYATRPTAYFETEHLCRWVVSLSPALVTDIAWRGCEGEVGDPFRPYLGVSLDPSGRRASAAIAWQTDEGVGYRPVLEVSDPSALDVDYLGNQIRQEAMRYRVRGSAYSGTSDVALARYLTKPTPVDGRLFANASANFASLVESRKLLWSDAAPLTDDLRYTIRKDHSDGAWSAVRSEDDRPITAALAAIRAVWLASAPKPAPPRIG